MKLQYHKIRGVDKEICTAEQKMAYNLVWANGDCLKRSDMDDYAGIMWLLKMYRLSANYEPGKYNEDAIFCCLRAGMIDYLKKPFIASSYEEIGKAFPAHYL